jgi:putative ABC transport system permease protein
MTSLQDGLAGPVKNASLLFMGAVLLVLVIACTNVANLLMARTADRAGELSIRSALGASRVRLARQLLSESLLLSFVATLAGLLDDITGGDGRAATAWRTDLFNPGWTSPGFHAGGVGTYSGVLRRLTFGVRRRHSRSWRTGLHQDPRIAAGSRKPGWRTGDAHDDSSGGSVSVGRAIVHLMRIDRGYGVKGVVTVNVSLDGTTHQLDKRQLPYFEEVLDRIRNLPGVRSASATEFLPLYASAFGRQGCCRE